MYLSRIPRKVLDVGRQKKKGRAIGKATEGTILNLRKEQAERQG
jgi:hypothetical protein